MQRGFTVEIYERRPDMRRVRMSAGRSINLALSTRGIHALQQAGLWERDAQHHHPDERANDAFDRRRTYLSTVREERSGSYQFDFARRA